MMTAIMNSATLDSDTAMLDSDTLFSSLRFTQKHSLSALWLWLKLIQSDWLDHGNSSWILTQLDGWQPSCTTFWLNLIAFRLNLSSFPDSNFMMAAILNSARLDSQPFCTKKNFTVSFSVNLMMAAILNSASILDSDSAILNSDTLLSSLRFTQKHSLSTLTLTQTISFWLKLIHSHLTWWWLPSCILPSWTLLMLDSAIFLKTLTPTNSIWIQTHSFWLILMTAAILDSLIFHNTKLHSFILNQHDDGSSYWILPFWIQPFCTKKTFTHEFLLNLMMVTILNSGHLGFSHLSFLVSNSLLPKTLVSILTLTQTNTTWLKLIHSDSTWWWQPSWTLPCWIQTPCYLPSDSLKNTLSLHSDSDSNYFILTQTHSFSLNLMMALPSCILPICFQPS